MTFEELEVIFKEVDESKRQIVRTMFDDFIYEYNLIEELKPKIKELKNPKNQKEADKLKYYTKLYADVSQRHDSKIKIFLSTLQKFEGSEENPITAWLKERKGQ